MQQYDYEVSAGMGAGAWIAIILFSLPVTVLMIAALWRVFTKAGAPGWAAIVPIYNMIVLLRIVGRPPWWLLLMFIPIVNIVVLFIVYIDLARSFGKDTGFGVLMVFFSVVCIPILGFGSARYVGPAGGDGRGPAVPNMPYPPQPYPGGPYQQSYPGQPYPGGPQQQQPYPGQPYPGGPYQQQPHPGQPYPGGPYQQQPHPGQQYPGQQ